MMYQDPEWAHTPPPEYQQWFLLEIKSGVQVAKYPLHSRKCTLLGRAADQVQIPLTHESISRQHARIAFDSQGIPWLRDLQSTHGTTCNKRRLPPLAIGKQETNAATKGARGVMIFPGDILQFGASTRLFCVEGPSDFERGAMKARQVQQEQLQKQRLEETTAAVTSHTDDDETDQSTSSAKTIPMDMEVPEKHRKTLERLNAMKYKLQNLETEDDRIRRKGELTEGQERQLQRNAEREKTLQQSILDLETELYDKLHPEKGGIAVKNQQVWEKEHDDDDDDDDFFDRTKRKDKSIVEDEESEATLIAKWKLVQQEQIERQTTTIKTAQAHFDHLSEHHAALEERGDIEEAFFVQNNLQLAKEALNKLTMDQKNADDSLTEIEKILRVVNSKIRFDRQHGYVGEGDPPNPKPTEAMRPPLSLSKVMLPPPSRSVTTTPTMEKPNLEMMPPPRPKSQVSPTPYEETHAGQSIDKVVPELVMPPPKRKRVVGPVMLPPSGITNLNGEGLTATASKKNPKEKKAQGTLSFLTSMNSEQKESMPEDSTDLVKESKATAKAAVDLKKDEWRAPLGQDGSGMTKLNAKFAGRY